MVTDNEELAMTAVRVFDPAMCCSTGICGPSVDPRLVRFAADLDWLKGQGVLVERYNLSQQPGAFADNAAVKATLEAHGEAGLPVVIVDGQVKSAGVFPSRDELAAWAGLAAQPAAASPARASSGCCGPAVKPKRGGGC
jgi:arsenical resistance operon trans-acting repressor ArsD